MSARRFHRQQLCIALAVSMVACALSVRPWRGLIEHSMVWHMAVQMPMLVAGGWLWIGAAISGPDSRRLDAWNRYGLTGFFASQVVFAYWMLPLAIDRAVVMPTADAVKVAILLACGAMLKHSFDRSPPVMQLFFVGYAVSTLVAAGVFLATTESRLCNAYLMDSQVAAGWSVAVLGVAIGVAWGLGALQGVRVTTRRRQGFPDP